MKAESNGIVNPLGQLLNPVIVIADPIGEGSTFPLNPKPS
jgi:hypothetical protein